MTEELKFERPVHEDGPGRQFGGPKPDQEANLEAKSWLRSPTWRSKSDLGGQLGGPKLTQEATSETQAGKEANLDTQRFPGRQLGGRKAPQEADFGGKRRPRAPTWSENGANSCPKRGPEDPKMKTQSQHKRTRRKWKKL